jgi:hypothetical protein
MNVRQDSGRHGICLSDFALDELWLCVDRSTHPASDHIENCQRCQKRFEAYGDLRSRFVQEVFGPTLDGVVTAVQGAGTGTLPGSARTFGWPWALAGSAAVTLVVLGLILALGWQPAPEPGEFPSVEIHQGIKGAIGLEIWGQSGSDAFRLHQDDQVVVGDALRFAVQLDRAMHLMVFVDDGSGISQVAYPSGQRRARQSGPGRHQLEGTWVLPQGPVELFVTAVATSAPFGIDDVRAALSGRALDAPVASREALESRGFTLITLRLARAPL